MSEPINLLVFILVVGSRFLVPLWIPRFPLPAILLALVLDGIDGGVFEQFTTLPLDNYQSYDKALDIYYLTIAYLSTIRNWTNPVAVRVAAFLLYYRLVGVVLFEYTGSRWLLFIFPNTFEYFFILFELARLRWDMVRVGRKVIIGAAAAIWIVIKLPQEYWIHIAQRDVTDTLAEYPTLIPVLAIGFAFILIFTYWIVTRKLPPADHAPSLGVDIPVSESTMKHEMLRFSAMSWRDQGLLEKAVLIALLSFNFSQILPGVVVTTPQLVTGIVVVVVLNAAISEYFARLGWIAIDAFRHFGVMLAINLGLATVFLMVLPGREESIRISNTVFLFVLVSLLVSLFDRFRVIDMVRDETANADTSS